jgi:hypothetical protein
VAVYEIIPTDGGYALESLGFCLVSDVESCPRESNVDAFMTATRESGESLGASLQFIT